MGKETAAKYALRTVRLMISPLSLDFNLPVTVISFFFFYLNIPQWSMSLPDFSIVAVSNRSR